MIENPFRTIGFNEEYLELLTSLVDKIVFTTRMCDKHKYLILKLSICSTLFMYTSMSHSQDLGQIGKAKLFKLTGGVAANTVFYKGTSNREQFTYFLTGSVNLNISNIYNIPFSFSYSNQKFENSNPFSFNRLSIHPSYKWVTTHIGDVSMSFSPYTLNNHQFTGVGVDLAPEGPLKISAMYGRLLKEFEFIEDDPQSQPSFRRIGYGAKARYEVDRFAIGAIFFKASDDPNSIENPVPVALDLDPKENVVVSLEGKIKIFDKGVINVEVASSVVTENINLVEEDENPTFLSSLLNTNASTQQYKAYNANFSYPVGKGTVGLSYEFIDPEYRTLGAYFFNNDLENITINATQNLFNNKVNLSFNGGVQRDDLDNTNDTQLQRVVSSFNATYNASEKLNLTASYSNFQSFTNIKNQFDFINEVSELENIDTLNFQQVSQNANLNANYILKDTEYKKRNLNIALSYQSAVNKQGGETVENGDSNFYNGSVTYSLGYPENNFTINTALNVNFNTIGVDDSFVFGPTLSANKHFFDKTLRTTASISYNQSQNNSIKQNEVTNIRLGSSYVYKKRHNFSLNALSQFRSGNSSSNDFTVTFSYNHTFGKFKPDLKFRKKERKKKEKPIQQESRKEKLKKGKSLKTKHLKGKRSKGKETILFKHRDSVYQGTLTEINAQLRDLQNHEYFAPIPIYKRLELTELRESVSAEKKIKEYKPKALDFLKELYSYEDFLAEYNQLVFDMLQELRRDMLRLDYTFEKAFVKAKVAVDDYDPAATGPDQKTLSELQKESETALARLIAHRWTLPIISSYSSIDKVANPDKFLKVFMEKEKDAIFRMKDEGKDAKEIEFYMISRIIESYMRKSINYTNPNKFNLKYTEKR